ncbi:uncharacterized protein LOC130974919 [Arachis stenosperma]|uniref:uncharacterized protein LOC130974919 n=1 Tax=Arachis stenosperma TaxID=217475 RepID=UPI0025AD4F5A|nr:uncharacterized protein LOC130974919 [Arachis stenosperma]
MIELYVEFAQQLGLGAVGEEVNVDELGDIDWEEDNNDSEEEFEANYEVDDENDDGDLAGNSTVQNEADAICLFYLPYLTDGGAHVVGEGNAPVEDGEFSVGMEFGSSESVISAIKSYTISRGVDYTVYESEPRTFYGKCKEYGEGFNYTVSYRKAWLAKQKAIAKGFGDWKVSYRTLPVWLKAVTMKIPRSRVQIKTLPVYRESEEVQGVDGTHLYGKYKGALLVAVAQDGNQNIVPIAFVIVEGETADAWEFFLTNLWRYVVTVDGVDIISDCHTSIDAAIARSNGVWSPLRAWHMYCIRHIGSNFLRRFKAPYLHKLVRLKERGEAYTQWCEDISVERWVLAFDRGHHWGHMMTNLVECINSVLKAARNLPVTAIVRSTFYRMNELFTQKIVEAHERVCNGFTYTEFARRELKKAFDMQETLLSTGLTGEMRCLRFAKCKMHLDWQVYVHDVYKMSEICKVYRGEFIPMGDPSTWDIYEGAKVIANYTLRRATKGRLKSTRYLNEMDSRDIRDHRRCTVCGRKGHSRSRCPHRAGPSTAGGH